MTTKPEATSIAHDLLRNGYDRWFRLEEEKAAIGEDLKELFAELKGHGFTPKALRENFRRVRNINDADQQEHDAIVDLYVASLIGARPAREARVENIEEFDAETGEIIEPLPAPQVERDLTSPSPQAGQVATHPEAKASEDGGTTVQHIGLADDSVTGDVSRASDGAGSVASIHAGSSSGRTTAFDADNAGSIPAPATNMYAEPGVVVTEHTPPEPVRHHPISAAFAELGQSSALRNEIFGRFGGVKQPIVKIGCEILDGWARYNAARTMHIDYPVVQYSGTDILADAIRWNLASRKLTQGQISTVISRLVKLYPDREQEILGMFDAAYEAAA